MTTNINLENTDKVNIKIAYLNFLQNIINRMSTIGISMKTASVTTLIALLAYSTSEEVGNNFKVWMFLIPWIFFAGYHAYFLKLERTFRNLYNMHANQLEISFNDFKIDKNTFKQSDGNKLILEKWNKVIFSKQFLIFHFTILIVVVISFIKIKGLLCL